MGMDFDIKAAVADIESTPDLLERAFKLAGVITTMFQEYRFNWEEAERLAALPDFGVLKELCALRKEVEHG